MTTTELFSHLRSLNVKVWAQNGQLFCDGPKGALTPDLRAALSERKAEILVFLKNAASAARLQQAPLRRGPRDGDLPLSFAQQRLWFIDQLEPNNSVYNVPGARRLKGPLNVTALQRSLNEIVRRHEVLRTIFSTREGQPLQLISPALILPLPVVDLRDRPQSERETEARRLAAEETQRIFDLARGPLLRTTLLRLAPEDHVLLLTMHHIVSDGWSMGVFFRELSMLYDAFSTGYPPPLAELPLQYADFAQWQRQWLQEEALERQLSYWKNQLEGISTLELPTDRPRPPVQNYRGAHRSLLLPKELSQGLKALSLKEGGTLFMTLLSAFQTLLHRYTGQDDIAVGSPIAGRNRHEIEGLIGFFVNTLVMRNDLSGNPTFRELLARVRETALAAYAHQDLPFEKLVQELHPERNLSHSPLFQAILALQNTPTRDLTLSGLNVSPMTVENNTAKFDLSLSMIEDGETLRASAEYRTDLFDAATIERMLRHFQNLLEGIVANPEQRLSDLTLLTNPERHQLLVEWNDTRTNDTTDEKIHEIFEAQVERTPDAVAVVFGDKQLTYRELNRRANQLAQYLRKLGVGPEVPVGICTERSLEMVVGLLGVLKAGGAYVPLDPSYPKERLAFMLRDTQAPVVLTQAKLLSQILELTADGREDRGPGTEDRVFLGPPSPVSGPSGPVFGPLFSVTSVVCLDRDWELIAEQEEENRLCETTADNLAYVIYTSGSTGTPKGVGVTHRGVVRLVKEPNYTQLTAREVFLQFAPLSFDASTFEIWGSLLNGAKLAVFPPHTPSLEELGQALKQFQVTTLWLTSALFQLMVENHIESLSSLRQLLAGGDVLSVPHVKKVLKELAGCRLVNGYGPTENTTFTCCYQMTSPERAGDSISIGRPIAGTQVYILDHRLNPAPIGVPGELYCAGDGLARGYLNNQELTAEKFIPNPFSIEPGKRLYKTGDLARYLEDGNIEFLGRIDHQVKIRGFRIELGEIEAVLGQHPGISEAVVIAREDVPGDKRLVAYVVSAQTQAPAANELHSFSSTKLPSYMVPSAFVFLDALPLTPNGKVDRKALPASTQDRPDLQQTFVAPRTPVEKQIAQIWAVVLKLERIGIHDNFFDLGGHSLLATQVISRLRESFSVELPLHSLFDSPTVGGLASLIEKAKDSGIEDPPTKIFPVSRHPHRMTLPQ